MSQSHNDENPVQKLLLEGLESINEKWKGLHGLYASWVSDPGPKHHHSSPLPHEHVSNKKNLGPHENLHHSEPIPPPRKTPSAHNSSFSTDSDEFNMLCHLCVKIYNGILENDAGIIESYGNTTEHIPVKKISRKDLNDPKVRVKIVRFLLHDIGRVLEEYKHVSQLASFIHMIYISLRLKPNIENNALKKDLIHVDSEIQKKISERIQNVFGNAKK